MHRLAQPDKSPHQGVVLFSPYWLTNRIRSAGVVQGKAMPRSTGWYLPFCSAGGTGASRRVPPQLANAQMGVDGQADGTAVVIFTSRTKRDITD